MSGEFLYLLGSSQGIVLSVGPSSVTFGVVGSLILIAAIILKPAAGVVLAASAGAIAAATTNETVGVGKGIAIGALVGIVLGVVVGIALGFSPLGGINGTINFYLGTVLFGGGIYQKILIPAINAIVHYGLPIVITTGLIKAMARQRAAPSQKSAFVGLKGGIIAASAGLACNAAGYATFGLTAFIAPLIIALSAIFISISCVRELRNGRTAVASAVQGE